MDGSLGSATCNDYDPATRSCGAGDSTAYRSISTAIPAAGDVVLIRAGTYGDQLAPETSGAAGSPVVYRAFEDESVTLSGSSSPAMIVLDGVSYIVIEGIAVADSRWVEAIDAHHNIIRGCTFTNSPASGTTGNVRFISSHHNRLEDNVIDDGQDNLLLIDSNHNVVEGNTISEGGHSLWGIRCGDFNVIRDNYFANTEQKIGEVYDCGEDTSAVPNSFQSTTHNLIEGNVFAEASSYYSTSGGNGIQYSGQDGIVRRNIFYSTNVGLGMQVYDGEAEYNERNRAYHNVFFENDCAGIRLGGDDNRFKNNILYRNRGVSGDCFGDGSAQLLYRSTPTGFLFERNNLRNFDDGEDVIQDEFGSGGTIAEYESDYPELFVDNMELEPSFTDAESGVFTLLETSEMIDAGAFLTKTVGSSTGTSMTVEDARYFYDGFEIEGEAGDLIQLEGAIETVHIIEIDYESNVLTLSAALTWDAGQGVSLAYEGTAPDLGAFEVLGEYPTCAESSGTCCRSGEVCVGGIFERSEDCESLCCVGGACELPDTPCVDEDGDGYGSPASTDCTHADLDCDDGDETVHPNAVESCNGLDDNCNSSTDELWTALGEICSRGVGACAREGHFVCSETQEGLVCDALAGTPTDEVCDDGTDNDCDGLADGADPACGGTCGDVDMDGYADAACGGVDCNDDDPAVHPDATEVCNDGIDNDCDEMVDDADVTCPSTCPDADEDGYQSSSCGGDDCDDDDAAIHPGTAEVCDDVVDNDCDGLMDMADTTCNPDCPDADEDGYQSSSCGGEDCNDDDAAVHPGAPEICDDGIDNDCDGAIDDDDSQGCDSEPVVSESDGCDCSATGTTSVTGWLALGIAMMLFLRRRVRQR